MERKAELDQPGLCELCKCWCVSLAERQDLDTGMPDRMQEENSRNSWVCATHAPRWLCKTESKLKRVSRVQFYYDVLWCLQVTFPAWEIFFSAKKIPIWDYSSARFTQVILFFFYILLISCWNKNAALENDFLLFSWNLLPFWVTCQTQEKRHNSIRPSVERIGNKHKNNCMRIPGTNNITQRCSSVEHKQAWAVSISM